MTTLGVEEVGMSPSRIFEYPYVLPFLCKCALGQWPTVRFKLIKAFNGLHLVSYPRPIAVLSSSPVPFALTLRDTGQATSIHADKRRWMPRLQMPGELLCVSLNNIHSYVQKQQMLHHRQNARRLLICGALCQSRPRQLPRHRTRGPGLKAGEAATMPGMAIATETPSSK